MDKFRIERIRRMNTDYESLCPAYADTVEFLKKHLNE